MLSSIKTPSLETRAQFWKARAEAKQQWLERALKEPATSPEQAARRIAWITRALKAVKRGQSAIKYHSGLVDAYAQHLNALEMALMSAAEQKSGVESPDRLKTREGEQTR